MRSFTKSVFRTLGPVPWTLSVLAILLFSPQNVLFGFLGIFLGTLALEEIFGDETSAPDNPKGWPFRAGIYLYIPVHAAILVVAFLRARHATPLELAALCLTTGFVTGSQGILIAHELVHSLKRWERALGRFLLSTVCYRPFYTEHVRVHHVTYCTPEDPATSKLGESLFGYIPRAIAGKYVGGWSVEAGRLRSKPPVQRLLMNNMLWDVALLVTTIAAVAFLGGVQGVVFLLGQSLVAITILETVTYIQHYGLQRKEIAPGKYERGGPQHSWDSYRIFTQFFSFNLSRHADHHAHPGRSFHELEAQPRANRLPFGYMAMVALAFVPPLFHHVMDRRVRALESADARPLRKIA